MKKATMNKIPLNFISPKSKNQQEYVDSIINNVITFCYGYPGSGKTILAISTFLNLFYDKRNKYKRIIVCRPYIHSNIGEEVGSLPGTLQEKVEPYTESIKDNLRELGMSVQDITELFEYKVIDLVTLSTLRGRSFNNCLILVEEAQNVPKSGAAMKLILTRLGKNSKIVLSGDIQQSDLNKNDVSFLETANLLKDISGIGIVQMTDYRDIQRSPIVREILKKFEELENGYTPSPSV